MVHDEDRSMTDSTMSEGKHGTLDLLMTVFRMKDIVAKQSKLSDIDRILLATQDPPQPPVNPLAALLGGGLPGAPGVPGLPPGAPGLPRLPQGPLPGAGASPALPFSVGAEGPAQITGALGPQARPPVSPAIEIAKMIIQNKSGLV